MECHLFLSRLKKHTYGDVDWLCQLERDLVLLKQLQSMWSTFLGGLVDLAMIFSIPTWKDLRGFDNNQVLVKLPGHGDTKHSRHLGITQMLLRTSKIT